MEEWSQDFFKMLETVAQEVEQFWDEALQGVGEAVEDAIKFSEEIVEQLEAAIATEIDPYLDELVDPLLEMLGGMEVWMDETAEPFIHTVDPLLTENPACVGCQHYHGQMYGGNLLVCAMHPYGWESDNCPDWESV